MKKRGDISLWFLIELLAAFLVAYLAVDVSLAYARGTIFEKLNVAKEIATQINALNGIPGDAFIVNDNLNGYSISIEGNRIKVFEEKFDSIKGTYEFVKIGDQNINFNLQNSKVLSKQIVITKVGNKITVTENIPDLV